MMASIVTAVGGLLNGSVLFLDVDAQKDEADRSVACHDQDLTQAALDQSLKWSASILNRGHFRQ